MNPAQTVTDLSADDQSLSASTLPAVERRSLDRYLQRKAALVQTIQDVLSEGEKLQDAIVALGPDIDERLRPRADVLRYLESSIEICKKLVSDVQDNLLVGHALRMRLYEAISPLMPMQVLTDSFGWSELSKEKDAFIHVCDELNKKANGLERGFRRGSIIPGTSFRLGAFNSPEQIKSLYGWPEYEVRVADMKPGKASELGFLGENEDFVELLLEDRAVVEEAGSSHQEIASLLRKVLANKRVQHLKNKITATCTGGYMGAQEPPLPGPIKASSTEWELKNKTKGVSPDVYFTEMHPDLIELWGFYEGNGLKESEYSEEVLRELMKEMDVSLSREEFEDYTRLRSYRADPEGLLKLFGVS